MLFFVLFLVVRGAPGDAALPRACSSAATSARPSPSTAATELPLVVAITTIAIETGHMKTSTAAGLVGAAMLSTLVFPFVGLALRKEAEREERETGPGQARSPTGEIATAPLGPDLRALPGA